MAGRDEVNVVAAQFLQAEHLVGQLFGGDGLAVALPTDVEVLAKDAAEVALAEEDGARARPAPQAILFAVVGKGTADKGQPPSAAVGLRTVCLTPVGMALPWTAHAIDQGIDSLAGSVSKIAAVVQFQVGRPE